MKLYRTSFDGPVTGGTAVVLAANRPHALRMLHAQHGDDLFDDGQPITASDLKEVPLDAACVVHYDSGDY